MILLGDEVTQHGNNNTYRHDNELSWLDWTLLQPITTTCFWFSNTALPSATPHPGAEKPTPIVIIYVGSGYAHITCYGTHGI